MPNPHPHLLLEREGALASIASDLHHVLLHLRHAHYYNSIHGLGLALPTEASIACLIGRCAKLHQQQSEKTSDHQDPADH